MTSLLALANDLKSRSEQLEHIMIESGVPMPSWKADAPPDFVVFGQHYDTIQTLRFEMIDALNNMNRLLCGPIEVIKDLTSGAVSINCRLSSTSTLNSDFFNAACQLGCDASYSQL